MKTPFLRPDDWIFETQAKASNDYVFGSDWVSCGSGVVVSKNLVQHLSKKDSSNKPKEPWHIADVSIKDGWLTVTMFLHPAQPMRRFRRPYP